MKWATALLQPSILSDRSEQDNAASRSSSSVEAENVVKPLEGKEYEHLLKLMHDAAPELRDYHIILVPKASKTESSPVSKVPRRVVDED